MFSVNKIILKSGEIKFVIIISLFKKYMINPRTKDVLFLTRFYCDDNDLNAFQYIGAWRSLVAYLNGVQRAGGSNPLAPTNKIKGLTNIWFAPLSLYPNFHNRYKFFNHLRI